MRAAGEQPRNLPAPSLLPQIIFVVGVQGGVLPIPPQCPAPLRDLMLSCWHEAPTSRPPFATLEERLRGMLERLPPPAAPAADAAASRLPVPT